VRYAEQARDYDLDLEIISGNALRQRFPFLSPEVLLGSYSPLDGHANPRLAAPAFGRAAERIGAVVHENTEVLAIEKKGDDFVVDTRERGTFRAPVVQISAGAWGGALSKRFGEPVPLVVRGPQMGVTEPVPYAIAPVMSIHSKRAEEGVYLRQGTRHLPHLCRIVPALASLRTIRTWSGIEAYLRDDIPVMGPSAKVAGLFYAFGFCGHGFQLGPGVGDVMAELIDTGSASTPIEPFRIGRFTP
jgi:sarcosine oxidase subunit beta